MENKHCNNVSSYSPYIIWRNYAIGAAAISVVPFAIMLLPAGFCQLFTLVLSLSLFAFVRKNRVSKCETCALVPYVVARSLLFVTIAYVAIDAVAYLDVPTSKVVKVLSIPMIHLIVLIVMRIRRHNYVICQDCILRNGFSSERKTMGQFYNQEYSYLVPRMTNVCIICNILVIGYLFISFHWFKSTADYVVVYFMPLIVSSINLLMLRYRFYLINIYLEQESRQSDSILDKGIKMVRINVFAGEKVYFVQRSGSYDSMFSLYDEFSEKLSVGLVKNILSEQFGVEVLGNIKFLYGSLDAKNRRSIEHYMCFIESENSVEESAERLGLTGKWFKPQEIMTLYYTNDFSSLLKSEIYRIFTVLATAKTYNADGSRKVPLAGYVPRITIADVKNTDFDFSDNRWMVLSRFNKDDKLYRVKLFWYRYLEGLG